MASPSYASLPASRRKFLSVAGSSIVATKLWQGPLAAADEQRLNTAVIGIGMRGKYLIANLPTAFQVTALCDCALDLVETARNPTGRFQKTLSTFATGDGQTCEVYQDYRQMLAKQSFDAVIIATPDHHHAQAAILALQAGAHVYLEKPLAVTIAEGRAIVNAANKYKRVLQVGSQQRTMQVNRVACEFIRAGGLGKIELIEERNLPGPMPYTPERYPQQPIPDQLDWNLFCGPTQVRDYNQDLWVKDAYKFGYLTWRGWDLLDDYSGHLMTNWGAHSIDMIQYALGMDDTGPVEIGIDPDAIDSSIDDQWHDKTPPLGTLPDRATDRMRFCPVNMRYANGTEVQFKPGIRKMVFHGEKGKLVLTRNNYSVDPPGLLPPPDPKQQARWHGDGIVARPHIENWLAAIRTGSPVNAPIEVGHRSATVCHLANIARRLSRRLRWDAESESFLDDNEANSLLSRPRRSGFELPE